MRRLSLVFLVLTACGNFELDYTDGAVIDGPVIDSATTDDAPIDGALIDAEIHDAEIHDAEIHDAEIHDAEIHDAEIHDAEVHDADPYDAEPPPDAIDPTVPSLTMVQVGFAGSYTVTPPGTSCGTDCYTWADPTEVTITLNLMGGANSSWNIGPCVGEGHSPTCTLTISNAQIQMVDIFCPTFVIDVVNGSDSNPGTCGAPFKTITKAASTAAGFQIIKVLPGTYNEASGETFPITLGPGVPMWGNDATRGDDVFITTTGATAVVCGSDSQIAGLTITAASGTAVNAPLVNCMVRDNTLVGNVTGLRIANTTQVRRNTIRNNGTGVSVITAGADLGTVAEPGYNELTCNTTADLVVADGVATTANGNFWDHAPPTGADVVLGAGASADTSDPVESLMSCP